MTRASPIVEKPTYPPLENGDFVFDAAADGMFVLDRGVIIAANKSACRMLGYDRAELVGCSIDALSADDPVYAQRQAVEWLSQDRPAVPRVFEWRYRAKSGRRHWAEISLSHAPLRGRSVGIAIARNISSRQTVARLAHRDHLTGSPNRWDFDLALRREITRSERSGRPLSVAMADIDHFKTVNDTFGHSAGDVVLRDVASFMRRRLRRVDYIARWGGDEFAFVLDATADAAETLLNRLRESIAVYRIPAIDRAITMSFGLTAFLTSDNPGTMIDRADRALYLSKQHGRNRTTRI